MNNLTDRLTRRRHKVEDTLRTKGSLHRFLKQITIEPFFLDPPVVMGSQRDLVEAIHEAMQRGCLIYIPNLGPTHPANAVWANVAIALDRLVSPWIECGPKPFSIHDIDEIASPSQTGGIFKSMNEFAEDIARFYPYGTEAEFQQATSHSFPASRRFTMVYRSWTGRYRWYNQDGSHHAALAQRYALRNNKDFHFNADLFRQELNINAVATLRQKIRGFLLPLGGITTDHHLRLIDCEVPFQILGLQIHGQDREAILLFPDTIPGELMVNALMSQLNDPVEELTAALILASRQQKFLPLKYH